MLFKKILKKKEVCEIGDLDLDLRHRLLTSVEPDIIALAGKQNDSHY